MPHLVRNVLLFAAACGACVALVLVIASGRPEFEVGGRATDVSLIPKPTFRGIVDPVLPGHLYRMKGCHICHSVDGSRMVGPTMKDYWGSERKLTGGRTAIADTPNFRLALFDPAAEIPAGYSNQMPTYNGRLTEEDVDMLADYLRSLSALSAPPGAGNDQTPEP